MYQTQRAGLLLAAFVSTSTAFTRVPRPRVEQVLQELNVADEPSIVDKGASQRAHDSHLAREMKQADFGATSEKADATISTDSAQDVAQIPDDGGSYTETEHESWFERMGDAMMDFVIGIILIIFSIPVLWLNEKRSAKMDSVVAVAQRDVHSATASKAKSEDRGTLVHISDGVTKAAEPVESKWFKDLRYPTGCLQLKTSVEVFQWIEKSSTKEKKDNLGGGKTKTTTYTYEKAWSSTAVDSNTFKDEKQKGKCKNKTPPGVNVGVDVAVCKRVEYGEGFVLPEELVLRLMRFQDIPSEGAVKLGDSVTTASKGTAFAKGQDGFYYHPKYRDQPEVGDARVKFSYVPEGPATVLALQCEGKAKKGSSDRDTFLPYRLFWRGWCGMMSDDELKRSALKEAAKTNEELADDDKCTFGPLKCLCCACNIITMFCAYLAPPQVFHILEGERTEKECFAKVQAENSIMTWVIRLLGWVMMAIGLYCLFSPLLTFVDIIPFLGPLISRFGGALIYMACFIVTAAVSMLIICFAYLAYRPLVALFWGFLVALCVAIPMKLIPMMQAQASAF